MFRAFPKIGQFRNMVKDAKHYYDVSGKVPQKLKFKGTVKLHGTNAAVCLNAKTGEISAQSRSRKITPDQDNAGFAQFVSDNDINIRGALDDIVLNELKGEIDADYIYLYGEWCGGNIQKGVALNQLEKMFVIFSVVVVVGDEEQHLEHAANAAKPYNDHSIYSINQFPTYEIEIDFNNPGTVQNELIKITEDVEAECPVSKQLGATGIGEGVVWSHNIGNNVLMFKVKGDKHSSSKVKKLASVDPEKIASIKAFVDYACTENRLNQGLENVELEMKNIGKFIGWVNKDINDEEGDVLESNGLQMKDVGKRISQKSREFFIQKLDENI